VIKLADKSQVMTNKRITTSGRGTSSAKKRMNGAIVGGGGAGGGEPCCMSYLSMAYGGT